MSHLRLALFPTEPVDPSVKVSDAARILACDESLVRRLVGNGQLRSHTVGKRGVRIYLSSIEQYRIDRTAPAAVEKTAPLPTRRRRSAACSEAIAFLKAEGLL